MEEFKEITVYCVCRSREHQFSLTFDPELARAYLEVHLGHYRSFFKRLWYGIRYIFGHRSNYGDWDCTIIHLEEARKLRDLLSNFVVDSMDREEAKQ